MALPGAKTFDRSTTKPTVACFPSAFTQSAEPSTTASPIGVSFKLLTYQRLHQMARDWEKRYPSVDIVLIEPDRNDELMSRRAS
jgi:hypothetical protein